MTFDSFWPAVLCLCCLWLLAATPLLRAADAPPGKAAGRVSSLDGLRGFLALGVFFHHAIIRRTYVSTGIWHPPSSRAYAALGPVAVFVFFMITGYLFWTKLIREKGRPDWVALYTGRIFRIGPVYLLAVAFLFAIVAFKTHFTLHQPVRQLSREVVEWLSLGFVTPYTIDDLNGLAATNHYLAGVTWTLHWEWIFYLSLVLTAWAVRTKPGHLLFTSSALAVLSGWLLVQRKPDPGAVYTELFLLGMMCASLEQMQLLPRRLPRWLGSSIALALVAAVFTVFPDPLTAAPVILLGVAFLLILSGADFGGLLLSRPARRLGDVSYGIYLLHGLVLSAVFPSTSVRHFMNSSPLHFWATILVTGMAVVLFATVAHILVEQPGIRLGRRVIGWLETAPERPSETATPPEPARARGAAAGR